MEIWQFAILVGLLGGIFRLVYDIHKQTHEMYKDWKEKE